MNRRDFLQVAAASAASLSALSCSTSSEVDYCDLHS